MSYRFMRVVVLFDLPMESSSEVREYTHFRKHLIQEGFMMLQKSVYVKLCLNSVAAKSIMNNVRKKAPSSGLVQMMIITEKQFTRMEFVVGTENTEMINSTDRLIIL